MWEKTLMSNKQIAKIYSDRNWIYFMPDINRSREVAQAQAEITWKARDKEVEEARQEGIRRVVEWVRQYAIHGSKVKVGDMLEDMRAHSELG